MYVCMYTHTMEYYSAIKKNKILPLVAAWMNLEDIMLKWSKSDRERQILYDITYMSYTNIKNKALMNIKKQKQTHR